MTQRQVDSVIMSVVFMVWTGSCGAAEWPQYRGPNQDGISSEAVTVSWGAAGPATVWRVPINKGFSSFAVSGDKVFTQLISPDPVTPLEVCVALDAATGKALWSADMGPGKGYSGGGSGDGPRSTPTVNDGMVYLFSPAMVVFGVDAATGKKVWSRDLMQEHAGRNIGWKNAASVAVDGDLVFVAGGGPGQSLLGLNKKTGAVVWQTLDEVITHSTPVVATILGQRQVIFLMKTGLVSVSPKDGKVLWQFPFPFKTSTAISPVVADDIVYCSAGYGVGGAACRISAEGDGFTAKQLWAIPGDTLVANHWSTPVHKDGYLYGMFCFKQFATGPLKCVELATGAIKWEQPGFGQGNVILVGNRLLALADAGQLVVVEATPTAYNEILRTQAVAGKCWSTPAFSDGRVYLRSVSEGVCLDVSGPSGVAQ